jgi:hypothetical protein
VAQAKADAELCCPAWAALPASQCAPCLRIPGAMSLLPLTRRNIDLIGGRGGGTRWRSYCSTSRKDAGSIPDDVTGIFH